MTKKELKALRRQEKLEQRQKEAVVPILVQRFKWWGLLGVVLALIGLWIYQGIVPIPPEAREKPLDRVMASDWVAGNPNASVVVMEYSDLQCPACRAYAPLIKQMVSEYGDRVAFVFRHFPLMQIHLHAEMAAHAAEAAGQQGKFFEMHDALFEHQNEWAESGRAKALITGYAQALGLNMDQFKKDWSSKRIKGMVKGSYMSGLVNNVNSTPTFYINGEKIKNPNSVEAFKALLDAKLGSPSATPALP